MKAQQSKHRQLPTRNMGTDFFYSGKPLISEMLGDLEQIDRIDSDFLRQHLDSFQQAIQMRIIDRNLGTQGLQQKIGQHLDGMDHEITQMLETFESIKQHIREQVSERQHDYLTASYTLHDQSRGESAEYVLNRRLQIKESTLDIVRGRILKNGSDWRYPGLIIRPGLEPWVEHLVTLDPLYVVDESWDLLVPFREKFPESYLAKVRMSVVNTQQREDLLDQIPDNQLGFCLAYNFFNYKPFEIFTDYLARIYQKLRPGGVVAMTINDCDRSGGARLCEQMFASYTPKSMVLALAERQGYQLTFEHELDAAVTWIELAKPGVLQSLKGGPMLSMGIDQND